ncbi:hypothetical protein CLIB1444_07S03620 [[Candida] jaroonii]|uniref:Uncharacterized protein n=1 Tax=[Candida] jaroonii TaxID=467808 RepID=A0ACA9YAB1_9ASCO|nr:hypothetical protein CLIB1444_07S03620 [[Candida] jaroonii]
MKQTSIFEYRSRREVKTFEEVVDLTSDNEELNGGNDLDNKLSMGISTSDDMDVESNSTDYVSAEESTNINPFLDVSKSLIKNEIDLKESYSLAIPSTSFISQINNVPDLSIKEEAKLFVEEEGCVKEENFAEEKEIFVKEEKLVEEIFVREDQKEDYQQDQTEYEIREDNADDEMELDTADDTLMRFYESDSDISSDDDPDYEYRIMNDIDLNYASSDEEQYSFKILGDAPKRSKQQNKINIDNISHLELVGNDKDACPVCKVFLGELTEQFRQAHIKGCLLETNFTVSPVRIAKEKAVPLVKLPSYRNDTVKQSPLRKIDPPKNVSFKSKRRPIPDLKIMEFPVNPINNFKVSMDAFNYCPHLEIDHYFLSHFHADHYGGISKKWCYERVFDCVEDFEDLSRYRPIIYCGKVTANLLTIKFGIDPRFLQVLDFETKYLIKSYDNFKNGYEKVQKVEKVECPGLYVTLMTANHCPGSAIFLFESFGDETVNKTYLHCGDFRINKDMLHHELLKPYLLPKGKSLIDKVYLDTTYLTFHYNFPKQEDVCNQISQMFEDLSDVSDTSLLSEWFGLNNQSRITDFLKSKAKPKKKFLIVIGTYVIGKERLAIAVSKRLNNCPIYISSIKSRGYQYEVVRAFEDEYLDTHLTENEFGNDDCQCVIHLVPMDIIYTMEEFKKYIKFNKYLDNFERCVGLRPTGWSHTQEYRTNKELDMLEYPKPVTDNMSRNQFINIVCDICLEIPDFNYNNDILPQNKRYSSTNRRDKDSLRIYSLPYSEHSSYRELTYFCLFLNIAEIIPTVGTEEDRLVGRMNQHISYWNQIKELMKSKVQDPTLDKMVHHKIQELNIEKF